METQTLVEPPPKKPKLPIMLGLGAAVLMFCCMLAVGSQYVLNMANSIVGNVLSQNNIETPIVPDIPTYIISDYQTPEVELPQGGLTDNLLRSNTWTRVQTLAAKNGCNTLSAFTTTIDVTQTVDSNGVWKEVWSTVCGDGSPLKVDVTFTPSAQGGIDISVSIGMP